MILICIFNIIICLWICHSRLSSRPAKHQLKHLTITQHHFSYRWVVAPIQHNVVYGWHGPLNRTKILFFLWMGGTIHPLFAKYKSCCEWVVNNISPYLPWHEQHDWSLLSWLDRSFPWNQLWKLWSDWSFNKTYHTFFPCNHDCFDCFDGINCKNNNRIDVACTEKSNSTSHTFHNMSNMSNIVYCLNYDRLVVACTGISKTHFIPSTT